MVAGWLHGSTLLAFAKNKLVARSRAVYFYGIFVMSVGPPGVVFGFGGPPAEIQQIVASMTGRGR